jgi:hypothetical protein
MRTTRGENSGEEHRNPTSESKRERPSGPNSPALSTKTANALTPVEEAELDGVFSEYDQFVNSLRGPGREPFDPCRAVLPLREALNTANLLVDCVRQSQLPRDGTAKQFAGARSRVRRESGRPDWPFVTAAAYLEEWARGSGILNTARLHRRERHRKCGQRRIGVLSPFGPESCGRRPVLAACQRRTGGFPRGKIVLPAPTLQVMPA